MVFRGINRTLQVKIRQYISYLHQAEQESSKISEHILKNELSRSLKNELAIDAYYRIFDNVDGFKNLSKGSLDNIVSF